MRRLITLLCCLLLLLSALPARAEQAYGLIWQSDWPIDPQSIVIEVVGGTLVSSVVDPGGRSGEVEATAERACLTIYWSATTEAGFPTPTIRRGWYEDCPKRYFPLFEVRRG